MSKNREVSPAACPSKTEAVPCEISMGPAGLQGPGTTSPSHTPRVLLTGLLAFPSPNTLQNSCQLGNQKTKGPGVVVTPVTQQEL